MTHIQHFRLPGHLSDSFAFISMSLMIKKAPEAANILWENLELSHKERARRKTLTLWVTIALLGASFLFLYGSNIAEREYNAAGEAYRPDKSLQIYGGGNDGMLRLFVLDLLHRIFFIRFRLTSKQSNLYLPCVHFTTRSWFGRNDFLSAELPRRPWV